MSLYIIFIGEAIIFVISSTNPSPENVSWIKSYHISKNIKRYSISFMWVNVITYTFIIICTCLVHRSPIAGRWCYKLAKRAARGADRHQKAVPEIVEAERPTTGAHQSKVKLDIRLFKRAIVHSPEEHSCGEESQVFLIEKWDRKIFEAILACYWKTLAILRAISFLHVTFFGTTIFVHFCVLHFVVEWRDWQIKLSTIKRDKYWSQLDFLEWTFDRQMMQWFENYHSCISSNVSQELLSVCSVLSQTEKRSLGCILFLLVVITSPVFCGLHIFQELLVLQHLFPFLLIFASFQVFGLCLSS